MDIDPATWLAGSGVVLLALFLISLFLAAVLVLTARSDRL